jgi:hypothetical protein
LVERTVVVGILLYLVFFCIWYSSVFGILGMSASATDGTKERNRNIFVT